MAYDLSQLKLEGLKIKEITACRINQTPGEHGVLTLTAYAEEGEFEEALSLQPVRFYAQGEEEENLFCGILTELFQENAGGLLRIHLTAKSYSILMDLQKKSRTFQDVSMTYAGLLQELLKKYSGADCITAAGECPIGALAVQYQETDWQFLKRMFSAVYAPLSCELKIPAVRIYAGIPPLEECSQGYELKEMVLDFEECALLKEMGYSLQESDSLVCYVRADRLCGIYSLFPFRGTPMVAARLHASIHRGLLRAVIGLKKKEGIVEVPQFPMTLVGLALEGRVLEVKGEQVRLHFAIDDPYPATDVYWFTYSTPSASPDGSGWYYMPEAGDCLRVYFPTKYMKDVLAISAVGGYEGKGEPDRMSNPNTKYLRSATGQEMNMGGSGICLASKGNAASLTVGSGGTISAAGKEIQIIAGESIDIKEASAANFNSTTTGDYKCQKGGSLVLDATGNLRIMGIKLDVN